MQVFMHEISHHVSDWVTEISLGLSQDSRFRLAEKPVPDFTKMDQGERGAVISSEVQLPLLYPIRLTWNNISGGGIDILICRSATRGQLSPWLHYSLRSRQHNISKTNLSHMQGRHLRILKLQTCTIRNNGYYRNNCSSLSSAILTTCQMILSNTISIQDKTDTSELGMGWGNDILSKILFQRNIILELCLKVPL